LKKNSGQIPRGLVAENAKFADLHLHTTCSDGFFTPEQLLQEAKNRRFSAIAITDHDTLKGSERAASLAQAFDIEIIPGVEITTVAAKKEFHILGYLMDGRNRDLLSLLQHNEDRRFERMRRMLEQLRHIGLDVPFEDLYEFTGKGVLGRLQLAHFLLAKKMVRSPAEAFKKYIGKECPGYVKGEYVSTARAIEFIRGAGGVAVWAHPGREELENNFSSLLKWGIQGLEVFHSSHSAAQKERLSLLAERHGLLITGGSDCHGAGKSRILIGEVKLPYHYVESLREGVAQCV